MRPQVEMWTDGSCSGNPGPGGWAFILVALRDGREVKRIERSGAEPMTTNNRMEMQAVVEGLRALTRPAEVTVYSDCAYIVVAYQRGWVERWKALGWRRKHPASPGSKNKRARPNSKSGELLNPDLWQALDAEVQKHRVSWIQVKGHAGVPMNERCDRLAVAAMRADLHTGPPIRPVGIAVS